MTDDAYAEVDPQEARRMLVGIDETAGSTEEEVIGYWEDLAERNDRFELNPDREDVELLAEGVLSGEEEKGLKYCPCQMKTGDPVRDLGLVCPCNFFIQPSWDDKGECWCSLFVEEKT